MNLEQFVSWAPAQGPLLYAPNAKREYLRGECVQLVCYYVTMVWNLPVIWADAAQWFTGGVYADRYDRIPYTKGMAIPAGAVVVMGSNTPGSGGAGHIMINLYNVPAGATTFVSLDQNWGGRTPHKVTHNFNYVIGIIVPKGGKGGGDVSVIPDADNYYSRYGVDLALRIRGRKLSRAEFQKYLVGQTDLRAIEILSDDNQEAVDTQHAQDVGVIAVRDRWDQQIYGLQDALKKQQDINNQLNQKVTELNTELAKATGDDQLDKQKIKELTDDIGTLTAQLEALHDQQTDAAKAVDPSTPEAEKTSLVAKVIAALLRLKK